MIWNSLLEMFVCFGPLIGFMILCVIAGAISQRESEQRQAEYRKNLRKQNKPRDDVRVGRTRG